jgi:hypothetical protein
MNMHVTERFCIWQGVGNDYYQTECGDLVEDAGRYKEIPKRPLCPNCRRVAIEWGDIQELLRRSEAMPDPNR